MGADSGASGPGQRALRSRDEVNIRRVEIFENHAAEGLL